MKGTNGCRREVAVLVRLVKVGLGLLVAGVVVSDVFAPANLTAAAPGDRADYVVA